MSPNIRLCWRRSSGPCTTNTCGFGSLPIPKLLVKQMQGRYKVASPDLRPLHDEAKRRVAKLDAFRIEHVLRGRIRRRTGWPTRRWIGGTGRKPAPNPAKRGSATAAAQGYVKNGVVHLLEGELPEDVREGDARSSIAIRQYCVTLLWKEELLSGLAMRAARLDDLLV